jgi:hypothetical protein
MTTPKDVFDQWYAEGHKVALLFNALAPGVIVPPEVVNADGKVCLEYGFNLPIPTADLISDHEGAICTMSFNRRPSYTFVPWHAVLTVSNGEHVAVFQAPHPTDAPAEAAPKRKPRRGSQLTEAPDPNEIWPNQTPAQRRMRFRVLQGGLSARPNDPPRVVGHRAPKPRGGGPGGGGGGASGRVAA